MNNVVYSLNKKYIDMFRVSCQSLIDNSTVDLNIFIMTKDLEFSEIEQHIISNYFESQRDGVKIQFVTSKLYKQLEKDNLLYKSLWFEDLLILRLCLHDALKVNWVTHMDADMIVLKNIDDLLTREFPMPIAGTLDLNYNKDTDYPYFCSALYKVSLDYWRKNNIHDQVLELLKKQYPYPDQDIMNIIFNYNKSILPPKYCLQIFHSSLTQISAFHNPSIVHFAGPIKPGQDGYQVKTKYDSIWFEYEYITKDLKDLLQGLSI